MNTMSLKRFSWIAFSVCFVLNTGCSGGPEDTYPVQGTVTVNGAPLDGGNVQFELITAGEKTGDRYTARGTIDATGHYRLGTFGEDDGATPGRYRVVVFPKVEEWIDDDSRASRPQNPVPRKYSSLKTTDLVFEVKPENNEIHIELQSGR